MRRIEMCDRVVQECEPTGAVLKQSPYECCGTPGLDADERLPKRLRVGAARNNDAPGVNANAATEYCEGAGVLQQVLQRLAVRSQRGECLVIERGETVVEECRRALGEDGRDQLIVSHLTSQDRFAPDRRVERKRDGLLLSGVSRRPKQVAE